jgi:hypothetical protein
MLSGTACQGGGLGRHPAFEQYEPRVVVVVPVLFVVGARSYVPGRSLPACTGLVAAASWA